MAEKVTVQLKSTFDYTEITKGLEQIKKQISSVHIGDDIAKDLQKSINKIELRLPKFNKLINKDELGEKDLERLEKTIQDITTEYEKIYTIFSGKDFTQAFSKIDLEKLKELDKQLKTIQATVLKTRDNLIKDFNKDIFTSDNSIVQQAIIDLFNVNPGEVKAKFKEIENNTKAEMAQVESRLREYSGSINSKTSGAFILRFLYGEDTQTSIVSKQLNNFKNQFQSILNTIQQVEPNSEEAKNALRSLMELLNNKDIVKNPFNEKLFNLPNQEDLKALNELKKHLDFIINMLKEKKQFFDEKDAESIKILTERVDLLDSRLTNLENTQKNIVPVIKENIDNLDSFGDKIHEEAENAKEARVSNDALKATFGDLASRIEHSISALTIFNKSLQIVRHAINSVKELDAAFTQIAIVSEQSNEQAWKMFDSFNKLAKQYSITTKDLTEGAKLFYQQGLNAADTMKMVEASTVSAALGEVTMTEAANTLTAAIQGYNESAAVAMDYTDKIAMVGAVSAADFNELSTAMEKTASSAYTAGIDFDHLLG